jgi:hypothetical protein
VVAPVFTDEELEGLRRFPEIGREDLFRFFTLAPADVAAAGARHPLLTPDRAGPAVARSWRWPARSTVMVVTTIELAPPTR